MNGGNIKLESTELLRSKATKVLSIADEINNSLSRADSEVTGILNNWKDENANIYEEKFNELHSLFTKCYNDLKNMGDVLNKEADSLDEQTANERMAVEGKNISEFDSI